MNKENSLASFANLDVGASFRDRQTVAGQISDRLREAIRTGVIKEGDELNQVGLAEHFGVSRVPIREALRALEAEGWIKAPTNQRAFVHRFSVDDIAEIFELRELIEVDLVGKAVGLIDEAGIAELEELCKGMEAEPNHETWVGRNALFHEKLVKCSGRNVAIGVVRHLTSQVERYLRPRNANPDRRTQANTEHRLIIKALREGDRSGVRALMRAHIRTTRKLVLKNLSQSDR